MAVKTFSVGETLTASDTNTYLANSGLVYVKSDTITSGSSKEITSAFSSTYTNYRVVIQNAKTSTVANIAFRLGTAATGYYGTFYYDKYDGTDTNATRANNGTSIYVTNAENLDGNGFCSFDVFGPNTTLQHKGVNGNYWGAGYSGWFAGVIANSTAYTSFTLLTTAGTFSACNVTVYGYRQA